MFKQTICGVSLTCIAALTSFSWTLAPVEGAPPKAAQKNVRPTPSHKKGHDANQVAGTITAVTTTSVTITPLRPGSTPVVLTVVLTGTAPTAITLDGAIAALSSLLPGMRAEASYQVTGTLSSVVNNAIMIRARDMLRVEGTITAVNATAGSVTITRGNGAMFTLTVVPGATVITLDGATAAIANLLVGMRAEARFMVAGTVAAPVYNASTIRASDMLHVEGTISAVNTTVAMESVTITRRNGTTTVTVSIVAATMLKVDGVTGAGPTGAPFTSLAVGQRAEAAYQITAVGNIASALRARTL